MVSSTFRFSISFDHFLSKNTCCCLPMQIFWLDEESKGDGQQGRKSWKAGLLYGKNIICWQKDRHDDYYRAPHLWCGALIIIKSNMHIDMDKIHICLMFPLFKMFFYIVCVHTLLPNAYKKSWIIYKHLPKTESIFIIWTYNIVVSYLL
jgi:hypothetical protein